MTQAWKNQPVSCSLERWEMTEGKLGPTHPLLLVSTSPERLQLTTTETPLSILITVCSVHVCCSACGRQAAPHALQQTIAAYFHHLQHHNNGN